jgi:hypothetical protein
MSTWVLEGTNYIYTIAAAYQPGLSQEYRGKLWPPSDSILFFCWLRPWVGSRHCRQPIRWPDCYSHFIDVEIKSLGWSGDSRMGLWWYHIRCPDSPNCVLIKLFGELSSCERHSNCFCWKALTPDLDPQINYKQEKLGTPASILYLSLL